jgi:hypothetical protein
VFLLSDGKFTKSFYWADHSEPIVDTNVVFIAWNSTSDTYEFAYATGTFVMNETTGKISHHNIFAAGGEIEPIPSENNDGRNADDPAWMMKMFFICCGFILAIGVMTSCRRRYRKNKATWEKAEDEKQEEEMLSIGEYDPPA